VMGVVVIFTSFAVYSSSFFSAVGSRRINATRKLVSTQTVVRGLLEFGSL